MQLSDSISEVEDSKRDGKFSNNYDNQELLSIHLESLLVLFHSDCLVSGIRCGKLPIDQVLEVVNSSATSDDNSNSVGDTVLYRAISLLYDALGVSHHLKLQHLQTIFSCDRDDSNSSVFGKLLIQECANFTSKETITLVSHDCCDGNYVGSSPCVDGVVYVGGFVLPTAVSSYSNSRSEWKAQVSLTPTTVANMTLLAQGLLTAKPIIVQGSYGCGKTSIIKELALALGQDSTLAEIQINDQTDSKTLIGSYVCSDVPGEFLWQPGNNCN